MKGGKRTGAGRPRGPEKKTLTVRVLPQTRREIMRRAARFPSLGALMDSTFKSKIL